METPHLMDYPARFGSLIQFFRANPYWFLRMNHVQKERNDKISYSTELWEAIICHRKGRAPFSAEDPLWDEVLIGEQQLRVFDQLRKTSYFTQKAP